jgi:hypothetical protein
MSQILVSMSRVDSEDCKYFAHSCPQAPFATPVAYSACPILNNRNTVTSVDALYLIYDRHLKRLQEIAPMFDRTLVRIQAVDHHGEDSCACRDTILVVMPE